ncbi:MAG TPA: phosphate-starvation-inducible PsiE family protein, partial [Pyrinomonadaceae bacterium]
FVQDLIVIGLCVAIFAAMLIKLLHLGQALMGGTDFSQVLADIMFILVLMELFRLLLIYLEEHRVSISTMVEVGIVAAIREALLIGTLHVNWLQLLVLCAFILTLGVVLRYAGIRTLPPGD